MCDRPIQAPIQPDRPDGNGEGIKSWLPKRQTNIPVYLALPSSDPALSSEKSSVGNGEAGERGSFSSSSSSANLLREPVTARRALESRRLFRFRKIPTSSLDVGRLTNRTTRFFGQRGKVGV